MFTDRKIGFIGAGNMAGALIKGIIKSGTVKPEQVMATDTMSDKLDALHDEFGITSMGSDNNALVAACDVIVLSVKPQIMDRVVKGIADGLSRDKLVISIAAGISSDNLEDMAGKELKIIRTMPNTPALVLEGATAISAGQHAGDEDIALAKAIFEAVGTVVVVDELQMDAVTGLSGSGPAYIFMMIEAMSDAGVKMGISRDNAMKLAAQTVKGAATLLIETGMHPGRLKDMVTSPGGTAIAGLHTLEQGGLRTTFMNAVEAATKRSEELGKKK